MATTEYGIEVMLFKKERMQLRAKKQWHKGLRKTVLPFTYTPIGGKGNSKRLLPYEINNVRLLAEWIWEQIGESGIYCIRNWVHGRTATHVKLNTLAEIKIRAVGEEGYTFYPINLRGISRHSFWRKALR